MEDADRSTRAEEVFAEWLALRGTAEEQELDELCDAHPDLCDELRRLHADCARVAPHLSGLGAADEELALVLERLRGRAGFERYEVGNEIARGGMGSVRGVWDADLRRELAMKVALAGERGEQGSPEGGRRLARFLEEAQITGRLDHPAIVPVHELGLDPEGRLYFTMRLVRGEDLSRILARVHAGDPEWSETRVLHVLLKACEALAYAHDKGVIHRDVKPANVMVGRFGEVYVMDWGLAKARGRPDAKDVRPRPPVRTGAPRTEVLPGRDADSPLLTMDGDVIGTPAYMSPEQARGDLAAMGPWSDAYSVGAILYHLLAGRAPYAAPTGGPGNLAVWARLQEGPPRPVAELAPDAPAELLAICAKAMARDAPERYRDTQELALDLRAFLEGRVVQAYRSGLVVGLQKWVRRNRALAASVAAAALLAIAGLASTASVQAAGRRAEQRLNVDLAEANAELANSAAVANRERDAATRAVDFLVELFEAPDPSQALGAPPTAEELLERGAERLDDAGALDADPLVKARLLDATGKAFRGLGRYERAGALLAEALRLRADVQGPDHEDALRTASELAATRLKEGRTEEAAQDFAETYARAERALGARNALTLELLNDLGVALQQLGRFDEAQEHLEASLAGRRAVHGGAHESTLVSLSALASLEIARGDYARAEELFAELFQSLKTVEGEDHPRTLVARNNLATLRAKLGRHEEALALYRDGAASALRVLGAEHPDVLVWRNNEANLLLRMGRADEARALLAAELPAARERFGSDHPRVAPLILRLGTVELALDRLDEAEALLAESVERIGALRGAGPLEALAAESAYGRLLLRRERPAEAEAHLQSALEGYRAITGPTSRYAVAAANNLAVALSRGGRTDEARALYAECLAAARSAFGDASEDAWLPWRNLIALELRAGRADAALELAGELLAATPADHERHEAHAELRERAADGDPAGAPSEETSVLAG
jgi:serine/threonine-protein kinase